MAKIEKYCGAYPYVQIDRSDAGVLTLRFHSSGGQWIFGRPEQDTIGRLFRDIAADKENWIVIIEGSGEEFCTGHDIAEIGKTAAGFNPPSRDRRISGDSNPLSAILAIEAPIIWCLNGPITVHPAIFFGGASIILADPSAYVQDLAHHASGNVIAGDTLAVWESLLGLGRARYFHLMAEKLDVEELKTLGIVHEIVPRGAQRACAETIADRLLALPPLTLRYSMFSLNQRLRRFAAEEAPPSAGMLGVGALDMFGPEHSDRSGEQIFRPQHDDCR